MHSACSAISIQLPTLFSLHLRELSMESYGLWNARNVKHNFVTVTPINSIILIVYFWLYTSPPLVLSLHFSSGIHENSTQVQNISCRWKVYNYPDNMKLS